jgi:hypothetical protein
MIPPGLTPIASASPNGSVQLRASFARWRETLQRNGKLMVVGVAQALANEIHSGGKHSPGTPIGNPSLWAHPAPKGYVGGFARSNWDAAIGAVPTGSNAGSPGASLARMEASAAALNVGETWVASNSAPYIGRLEFDQWSQQAPNGFVRPATRAIQQIVDEVGAHLESR